MLQTEGAGHGKILWKDLNVTASVVTVNQKGVLSLSADLRASEGKMGHVSIAVPSHPEVAAAELDIPLRYDYAFKANFSGSQGTSGFNGTDGMDGTSGAWDRWTRTIHRRGETAGTARTARMAAMAGPEAMRRR